MSVKAIEAEVYIQSGVEAEVQIGREIVKTIYEEPVLEPLEVTANGTYEPEEGIDGFNEVLVLVDVPSNGKIKSGKYIPGRTYADTSVLDIVTVEELGFIPKQFILFVSDINELNETRYALIKASYEELGTTPYYSRMTVKYTKDDGTTGTSHNRDVWTSSVNGYLTFSSTRNVVTFRTTSAFILLEGVEYTWYAWAEDAAEPVDPNLIDGEFTGTEGGVLTIDLPYTGDSYPKAVFIYDADGIIKDEVPRAYTMTAFSALKNNAQEPTYDGDTSNNGFRYQVVYTGTVSYTSTAGSPAYVFSQIDPIIGNTNCIKMPDNKTLKVYISSSTSGSSMRFRAGIRYKYQVFY